jgi:hypothetical protein
VTGKARPPASDQGGDPVSGLQWLIQGGTHSSVPFSLARGDQLDLGQILHDTPAARDLTNIGQFVKGLGPNDPAFGHGTQTVISAPITLVVFWAVLGGVYWLSSPSVF